MARTSRRRATAYAAAFTIAVLGGCVPPPPEPVQSWTLSQFRRSVDAAFITEHHDAWTNDRWFASISSTYNLTAGTTTLNFYPRTGTDGADLGPPQQVTPTLPGGLPSLEGGDHVVAIPGQGRAEVFGLRGDTWQSLGAVEFATGRRLIAMSDTEMVTLETGNPFIDSTLYIYALDTTGPTATATYSSTITPDPTWPQHHRVGFGSAAAIDGDLLAVAATAHDQPGLTATYRRGGSSWTLATTMASVHGITRPAAVAVNDNPTLDRVATTVTGPGNSTPRIDVAADTGGGFAVEASITPSGLPDESAGANFGYSLGIDDDTLVTTDRAVLLAAPEPGRPAIRGGTLAVYRKTSQWTRTDELGPTATSSPQVTLGNTPIVTGISGRHIAATLIASYQLSPLPCPVSCALFGTDTWSATRSL